MIKPSAAPRGNAVAHAWVGLAGAFIRTHPDSECSGCASQLGTKHCCCSPRRYADLATTTTWVSRAGTGATASGTPSGGVRHDAMAHMQARTRELQAEREGIQTR